MLRVVAFTLCRETIAVLRELLQKALSGRLLGLAVCYRTTEGSHVILTGYYRTEPEHALGAADLVKAAAGRQLDLFA